MGILSMKSILKYITSLVIICAICASMTSCALMKNDEEDATATSFINAVLSRDQKACEALTHPDYENSLFDVDDFMTALESDKGIEGSLTELKVTGREYCAYDSRVNGKTIGSDYTAVIGSFKYTITIKTLKNDNGYGVFDFQIN